MPTATTTLPSAIDEALHARDFIKLRDALKNWQPPDVAELINVLPVEDQAVVFRILPRKLAAETFGYLTPGQQEKLLKAMAQDEVTVLLNNMPDDDRTLLPDELPAAATKQMLELLTPEARADAVKLLGYPEGSIGRLMTAHYVGVREDWTLQYVLDYIREHVLDVAEAQATKEIQKIGGSEALDEPYMQIAFWRMVKKHGGWLVILFLGEMLTATAMGFFQREIERAIILALFVPRNFKRRQLRITGINASDPRSTARRGETA